MNYLKKNEYIFNIFKFKMTTLINIDNYTKKFEEYHEELISFSNENNLSLIPLKSMRGQALALMSQPEIRGKQHIGREEANKFFKNIEMDTSDAIQQFNKTTGIKRIKMRGNYCLEYPFKCDTTDLDKRKGVSISGNRDDYIDKLKNWWYNNLVNVPNNEWQIGHLDPTISDSTETNLAYQPPIQGKYRDRFKFDKFFIKMWPTVNELVPKLDEYYTNNEQKILYNELKMKFENQ
tara:strand:+ start:1017 stop:1721 length:705 start_codon:yes stop_codon:yes gene_type:complete